MRATLRPLVAVGAIVLMAACGQSPSSPSAAGSDAPSGSATAQDTSTAAAVYDKFNALTGTDRTDQLVEAAKKEGVVNVYTSNTDMEKVGKAFSDEYDIDVNIYRANSETVLQRLLQETKAGYQGVDFVDTNAGELNVIAKENLTYEYKGELRDKVRKEGQREGWTATRFNLFVIGYNTNLVPENERVKTLEELADPKWKGKISMEIGDSDWFAAMWKYYEGEGKPEDEIKKIFQGLASNSMTVKGHTVQGQLLSAGQFGVALSVYSHTVDKDAAKGAPVAWRTPTSPPAEPIVLRPNGAALMKGAKNPAAALLFMDFQLTEGQKVLAKEFRIGSVPGEGDPLEGLELITTPEEELLTNNAEWSQRYDEIIAGGTEIKG